VNFTQRIVVFIGLLVEAAMLLYPPWKAGGTDDTYRSIFSPAVQWTNNYSYVFTGSLDKQRLVFQCLIVAIVVVGFVVLLGSKKSKDSK